jgi:hypothetical protein
MRTQSLPLQSYGTALYYPYIHIRRPAYVKAALFYFDEVCRIVPNALIRGDSSVADDESEDVRQLVDEGLLIATPAEGYTAQAETRFIAALERLDGESRDQFIIDAPTVRAIARAGEGIHPEKIGTRALDRLTEMGFARVHEGWVSMRRELGAAYMFYLASEMSSGMRAPLFTDSRPIAVAGETVHFDADLQDHADTTESLLHFGIAMPSPEEVANIDVTTLAKFCRDRRDEKRAFRQAIEKLAAKVPTDDPHAFRFATREASAEVETAYSDLRASVEELGITKLSGLAKIVRPAVPALAVYATTGNELLAAGLTGLGISLEILSWYAESRGKSRRARRDSPYHYLLSMEQAVGRPVVGRARRKRS